MEATEQCRGPEHRVPESARRGQRQDLISAYIYLSGGCRDNRARTFLEVDADSRRVNGPPLRQGKP